MPSFSSAAVMPLTKAACASADSLHTAGSTTFRQTDVLERIVASLARKSIQGVRATQSATAFSLAVARAISALRPPIDLPQASVSSQSSTHSIEGVLMVSPTKIPSLSLPPLVMRKTLGNGHGGV